MSSLDNNEHAEGDGDNADAFLDGATPSSTKHAQLLTKKAFLPWHKPRKQWLRTYQWNSSISQLAQDLNLAEINRPLNYLSLPGQDLLDIRDLSPVCEKIGVKLKFLGLNYINPQASDAEQMQVEQDLSESEVRGMSSIDSGSFVINERFEYISKKESIVYDKLINSHDTFDIVNIDLCGSFGRDSPADNKENLYDALHNLFSKQAENRHDDWLFFLTTRNDTQRVHADVWEIFVNIINAKAKIDSSFLSSLIDRGIISKAAVVNGELVLDQMTRRCHVNVFGISIGFWIAHLLINQRPAWRVSMLPSYGYHVRQNPEDDSCDMISLAFRFSKVRLKPLDPHDLSRNLVGDYVDADECKAECEGQIVAQHCQQIDVDIFLYEDSPAYDESLNRSKELLSAARYDIDFYLEELDKKMHKLVEYLQNADLIKKAA